MALEQADVERLASEARDIATLASLVCNCAALEHETRALEVLRTLEDALEQTHTLAREMIDATEE